jgi:hypothetical protein
MRGRRWWCGEWAGGGRGGGSPATEGGKRRPEADPPFLPLLPLPLSSCACRGSPTAANQAGEGARCWRDGRPERG